MNDSGSERRDGWNPYLAGVLAGVLAVCSAVATAQLTDKARFFGTSTTFVHVTTFLMRQMSRMQPGHRISFAQDQRIADWQFMLVVGILCGALLGALSDGSFKSEGVPPIWSTRFGGSWRVRAVGGFVGGIVAMFGARLAGGCPSGHGLSGLMQLSLSGFVALALFFGVGWITARLLYRGGAR